jgi:hypothetical protein
MLVDETHDAIEFLCISAERDPKVSDYDPISLIIQHSSKRTPGISPARGLE